MTLLKVTRLSKVLLLFGILAVFVCLLIGMRVNAQGGDLPQAAQDGDLPRVKALLAAKADVNTKAYNGATALMVASGACHPEVVQALLAAGADVNVRHPNGATALTLASENGCVEAVRALLVSGADVNVSDRKGQTALMQASANDHLEVVRTLIAAKADVNAAALNGLTALIVASQNGHQEVVRALLATAVNLNTKGAQGFTALMEASGKGRLEVVRALIAAKADLNAKNRQGATALMVSSANDHLDVVRALLDAGADVNVTAANGINALMMASGKGRMEVVHVLLAANADVNVKDGSGATALIYAAQDGYLEVARALLGARADVNYVVPNGATALMVASQNGHQNVVQLLKNAGAVDVPVSTTPVFVPLPADINCTGHDLMSSGRGGTGWAPQSIGGLTCWISGASTAQNKEVPLSSGEIANGMLATVSFGDLKVTMQGMEINIAIRQDKLQSFRQFLQGKHEEAFAQFQKALELDPSARNYYNIGATLVNSGKTQEATEYFKKAIATDPNFDEAYYQLGLRLSGNQGSMPDAIKALEKYVSIGKKPDHVEAAKQIIAVLQKTISKNVSPMPNEQEASHPKTEPPTSARHEPIKMSENVQESKLIRRVSPIYPELARNASIEGKVILVVIIDEKGNVEDIRVTEGHPLLNDAAIAAVKQWKYTPTLLEGEPIRVLATSTVIFKLQR